MNILELINTYWQDNELNLNSSATLGGHTSPIFDIWSAVFKHGGIRRFCIDNNPPFYTKGNYGIKT